MFHQTENLTTYYKNLGCRVTGVSFCGNWYQLIFYHSPQLLLQGVKFTDHLSEPRRRVWTIRVLADFQPQEFPQRDSPRCAM